MMQMLTNCSNGTAGRPATKANSGAASESSDDSPGWQKKGHMRATGNPTLFRVWQRRLEVLNFTSEPAAVIPPLRPSGWFGTRRGRLLLPLGLS